MTLKNKLKSNFAIFSFIFLKKRIKNSTNFFFFPFYHIGGAERVHIDILSVFPKKNNLCFITNTSKDSKFKKKFEKYSTLNYLGKLIKSPFKKFTVKIISTAINKIKKPTVFGCNTAFFYELIPHLQPHVKVIDLTHAFSDGGIEITSLPHIKWLDKRIVLGQKTFSDYKKLYEENNISKTELDKLVIIKNKVISIKKVSPKTIDNSLNVLFVGRNSPEKRFHIILKVAKQCFKENIPVQFTCIGDFTPSEYDTTNNIHFTGEIECKTVMNNFYKKAHLLLISSSREGFPMVILEGMAHGVVPISTEVGEISEIINQKKMTGVLIDNNQPENKIVSDFIDSLLFFINNKEQYFKMSKKVVKTIEENFSEENFSNSYMNLLNK